MKNKTALIFLFSGIAFFSRSQVVSFIEQSTIASDSSYYDIYQINANQFWIAGKYGVLKKMDTLGNVTSIEYPANGYDLLKINRFGNRVMICGDKGTIYFCDENGKNFEMKQLDGYSASCFYNSCVVNDSVAFICGGNSKISIGKKAFPKGFILKTTDSGKTWNPVYNSFVHMVWDMEYKFDNLLAVTYTTSGTNIISTSDWGMSWIEAAHHIESLIHDIISEGDKMICVGAKTHNNLKNEGVICSTDEKTISTFKTEGLIWSYASSGNHKIATASNGNLIFSDSNSANWTTVKTNTDRNLYQVAFVSDNTAFVVGSRKTIIKVSYPEEQSGN